MLFYVQRHTCADGAFEWYVPVIRARAYPFRRERQLQAEREKLQAKLDLAKPIPRSNRIVRIVARKNPAATERG